MHNHEFDQTDVQGSRLAILGRSNSLFTSDSMVGIRWTLETTRKPSCRVRKQRKGISNPRGRG